MRLNLLILSFLLSVCAMAQTGILGPITSAPSGGLVNPWTDALVDNGAFYPATTRSTQVAQYEDYKYGWFLCYGMNSYAGYYWTQPGSGTYNPLPATTWDVPEVNVKAWADSAQAHNVDYVVLTVLNEFGFALWPSEAAHNMSQVTGSTGQLSPYQPTPYSVAARPTNDQTIVDSFAYLMRQRGIEPVAYVCLFTELNIADGNASNLSGARLAAWVNYYQRVIQELIVKYGFKYIWLDMVGGLPYQAEWSMYNAAKSVDPTVTIIGNVNGETGFESFAYDIQTVEEYYVYGGDTSYRTNARVYSGTTYYVGQEICATPYGVHSQWYDYPDDVLLDPPYTLLVRQDVSEFQGIVDEARAYNRPFLSAVLVRRDGTLLPDNLDFLRLIDFE